MIYIDRTGFAPDVIWLEKADKITKELMVADTKEKKHRIIDDNEILWGELKDVLMELSHQKCWYSESKDTFSYYHVDHFRPKKVALDLIKNDKGGYWWLAFNWTNYRVCGAVGNVNKRDKFAVFRNKANEPDDAWEDETIYLLDPCLQYDPIKLTFNNNGEACSLYPSGFYYLQTEYTITTLKLNYKKLKEARKKVWTDCSLIINELSNLLYEESKNQSATRRGKMEILFKQLKEFIKPTSEFSATARACLKSTGIEWAISIAA
ncbi:MAG: hypothetical protein FD170_2888 [Bacteroidetes bacterium]|nr:MAG: hypothetical protein FD170_2888 [Bacteroidota bacterium]